MNSNLANKHVLVTGGAGYIGSHCVSALLKQNCKVTVYDNLSTGFRDAVDPRAHFIFGDVRDSALVSRVMKDQKIDAVIHFAAKLVVPESVQKPLEYYENNFGGTLALLQACNEQKVKRILFSSTAAVYGNQPQISLFKESDPLQPMNPYGASKLMSEQVIKDFHHAYGLSAVVLRYFNVAGSSADGQNGQRTKNASHLLKVASEVACGLREKLQIFGNDFETPDGTGVRDYIHVEDLIEAHVKALGLSFEKDGFEIFNVGYGQGFSVLEILKTMSEVSGIEIKYEISERRAGDPAKVISNSEKMQKHLGVQFRYNDIKKICFDTYQWEKTKAAKSH
jgi:UDP-glucose 4-epimerase